MLSTPLDKEMASEGFYWQFSGRSSPQDSSPLNPRYESRNSRLKSFSRWENCTSSKASSLAELGFFFSPKPESNEGWIICHSCGCDLNFKRSGSEEALEYEQRDSDVFIHHAHCPYIKFKMDEGNELVKLCHIPVKYGTDDEKEIERTIFIVRQIRKKIAERRANTEPEEELAETSEEPEIIIKFCQTCKTSDLEVTFYPCNHSGCCIKCSKDLSTCNVCDESIDGIARYYPSNFEHNVFTAFRPEDI